MRRLPFVVALLTVPFFSRYAEATFHEMNIVELFPGTAASPNAQYVVLQMWADDQNFVGGHALQVFDAAGGVVGTFTFADKVNNGVNQDKILIATSEAVSLFGGLTGGADLAMTPVIALAGGKICWADTVDCVAWGNYSGGTTGVGTAFLASRGLHRGEAVHRDLGTNGILEPTDDHDDSALDFKLGAPAPVNNLRHQGQIADLIRKDGVESGDLTEWSTSSTDGGDLSVTPDAALASTSQGIQAVVNDTNPLYVEDDTPAAEGRYRSRFYFDPHDFDPGEASSHFRVRILIGFDGLGQRAATIVLRRQSGAYSVEGRVRRNDGTRADTGFVGITTAPHRIELNWVHASAPAAANGTFELFVDDQPVAFLTGIDDDASNIDSVRLGALAVKTGAAGTLYFDEFESRRQAFIGDLVIAP